jgi:hypothetical protein
MADLDDINDAIAQNAVDGIKKQKVGNEETEVLPIADQIAAANHIANQQAVTKPGFGFRFQQIEMRYR